MLRRPIPSSGEEIAAVGLGTWRGFDIGTGSTERAQLRAVLDTLFDGNASVVDSSPMYGRAEGVTGDLLADMGRRDDAFIATKVWTQGGTQGIGEMEDSFRLLKTDTIDLMQVHNLLDWRTHLEPMRAWKAEGRLRYTGYTHYRPHAFDDLMDSVRAEPVDFLQFCYSIDERDAEDDILPFCAANGIATLINVPFRRWRASVSPERHTPARPRWRSRLHELGPVLPQIRDIPSGGHLRHSRHRKSRAYGRYSGCCRG